MNNLIICAFYFGNHYEVCAKKLIDDCEEFGLEYDICSPASLKKFVDKKPQGVNMRNWICRYKPIFIRNMLKKHKKPILYLDVDGSIKKLPNMKAFRNKNIGVCPAPQGSQKKIYNTIVSCIYFDLSEVVMKFLDVWECKCMAVLANKADHWFFKTTIVDFNLTPGFKVGYMGVKRPLASKRKVFYPTVLLDARQYRMKYKERKCKE